MKDYRIPGNYKWTFKAIAHFQILFNTPVMVVKAFRKKLSSSFVPLSTVLKILL